MILKSYKELNSQEKQAVHLFQNKNKENAVRIEETEKYFTGKIYGYGAGSLFCFEEGKVIGKINVVLEVCEKLGNVYIHQMGFQEDLADKSQVVEALIEKALEVARSYEARHAFLGVRNKEMLEILSGLGIEIEYHMFQMMLPNPVVEGEVLKLRPLEIENKEDYLAVYNASFSDMPQRRLWKISDVNEVLQRGAA